MDTCKICGASRDPASTTCKYCETAYVLDKITGEVYINALRTILTHIDNESRKTKEKGGFWSDEADSIAAGPKATAIATFAMPSDLDNIITFFSFCHGNVYEGNEVRSDGEDTVSAAWAGKAKAAYTELLLRGGESDPKAAKLLALFADRYGPNVKMKKSGCFIATAAMGDYQSPSVRTLRAFRDAVLLECSAGERFVEWYYSFSPTVAAWISERPIVCGLVKWGFVVPLSKILEPVVRVVCSSQNKE